jgi:hypothetical protein
VASVSDNVELADDCCEQFLTSLHL